MAKKIKLKQVRSLIGSNVRQKKIVKSLGLGKINKTVTHDISPSIQGMINKVSHIVAIEGKEG